MISLASATLFIGYLLIYAAVKGGELTTNPLAAAWPK
jgi:hypothetical protein